MTELMFLKVLVLISVKKHLENVVSVTSIIINYFILSLKDFIKIVK